MTKNNYTFDLFAVTIRKKAAESIFNEVHPKLKSNESVQLRVHASELLELVQNLFLENGYRVSFSNGKPFVTKP